MLNPLGPIIKLIDTVVDKALPDADKARQLKAEMAARVLQGGFDTEIASITAINATMQAEAKSEHWLQWSWRPLIGYTFSLVIINNYVLMPYVKLPPIPLPAEVWTAMLVILGASAATRGWEKVAKLKSGSEEA